MRIVLLLITAIFVSACATRGATEPVDFAAEAIDEALVQHVQNGFAGVILVARDAKPILFRGYGSVNGHQIRADDRFWLASAGKQFASAAIFKLRDEGKLSLDDSLSRFFPAVPADKTEITVRHLLTHMSGLGQSYVSEGLLDRQSAVERMLAEPLKSKPGAEFRYSNSNTQLAAAVVEVASGLAYADFVRRFLWNPAALNDTGLAGPQTSSSVSPIAGAELPERLRQTYWGQHGVFSTAGDLARWLHALRSGTILSERSMDEMFAPAVRIGEGYATSGWFRGATSGGTEFIFVRGNEDFGANSLLYFYPSSNVTVVVLTHAGNADEDTSWSRRILRDVEQALGF